MKWWNYIHGSETWLKITYGLFPEGTICFFSLPQGSIWIYQVRNRPEHPSGLSELASRATTLPTNVSRGGRGKRKAQVLFKRPSLLASLLEEELPPKDSLKLFWWRYWDGGDGMVKDIEGYTRNSTIGTFLPEFGWGNDCAILTASSY